MIPSLTAEQLLRFRHGELNLDALSREYICGRLEYQYVTIKSSEAARELERRCRRGEVFAVKPTLNPL